MRLWLTFCKLHFTGDWTMFSMLPPMYPTRCPRVTCSHLRGKKPRELKVHSAEVEDLEGEVSYLSINKEQLANWIWKKEAIYKRLRNVAISETLSRWKGPWDWGRNEARMGLLGPRQVGETACAREGEGQAEDGVAPHQGGGGREKRKRKMNNIYVMSGKVSSISIVLFCF